MKKRMLYIAPDHYCFYEVVLEGFQKFSGYDVQMIISNEKYKYKHLGERILNIFYKTFLNKNIKLIKQETRIYDILIKETEYDLLFINRPDILNKKTLELATQKAKRSIVYFWDSFDKIKGQADTIRYFDSCYSFDQRDCKQFGIELHNNFYFDEGQEMNPYYDVFFLGTFDKRFDKLRLILDKLNDSGKKVHAKLYYHNPAKVSKYISHYISFIEKIISFKDASSFSKNTKVILDIDHENQVGLSFRPFEAMGLRKKLITTNPNIKEYDFYNPNNIFVWSEENSEIPESFFNTPYQDIEKNIYEKYSLKNWVNEILS